MSLKVGDLVIFKQGLYPGEEGAVYELAEINGDRCFIDLVNTKMKIRPQTLAMVADLVLFTGDISKQISV